MPEVKILRPMFDVRPVDQSGRVDFEKIGRLNGQVNLRNVVQGRSLYKEPKFAKRPKADTASYSTVAASNAAVAKELLTRELREFLERGHNWRSVLTQVGGEVHDFKPAVLPKRKVRGSTFLQTKAEPQEAKVEKAKVERSNLFADPSRSSPQAMVRDQGSTSYLKDAVTVSSPVAREVEVFLDQFKNPSPANPRPGLGLQVLAKFKKKVLWLMLFGALTVGLPAVLKELDFRQELEKNGSQAVSNLERAKENIAKLDFKSAAENFSLAYESFSNASDRLNLLGSSLTSFLADLPGLGKIKSAQNLIKAGEHIAKAGENISLAVDKFYRTNFVSYLGLNGEAKQPFSDFINLFRDSLVFAQKRVNAAEKLMAKVDTQIIPEEKRDAFFDFQAQIPAFKSFIGSAIDYSDFLLEATGRFGPKKYLVLLENNTELRATGGFPGSYALLDFNRGFLRSWEVDDVYRIDGQARQNIIPPKELQHITPTWGMRDANWFVNFPDSAKKVMEMYTGINGGPAVDGVIALTPAVITRILEITGPVELSEYGKVITSANFLAEIQTEVEYGDNRERPKQILVDFTPKFLEKLSQQDKNKWLEIFKALADGVEQKHILAYFKDPALQKTALENGLGGEIQKTDKDFLMVVHSNIKGSKTDAVTGSAYDLKSEISEDGLVSHTLSITRVHRGGKTNLGFYNRTNFDFVRVVVPRDSELIEIKGNSQVNFSPVIEYGEDQDFTVDEDLKKYEENSKVLKSGVKEFSEAEKTIFGFWLNTEPGQTRTVILKYRTPVSVNDGNYNILIQKQPGTLEDVLSFSFSLPDGKEAVEQNPQMQLLNNNLSWQGKLLKDIELKIKFQ